MLILSGKKSRDKRRHIPEVILYLLLLFGGIIHGLYVSGGALVVIYATEKLKEKESFRVTVAVIWIVLNSFIGIGDGVMGTFNTEIVTYFLVALMPALLATFIGVKLQKFFSVRKFLWISYVLIFISGITVLI